MNTVCLSENANIILKEALKSKGNRLIEVRKTDAVYDAVSSHADIYLCKVGNGLVVAPEQLPLICGSLTASGAEFIPGSSCLGDQYPMNVKYNAAQVGRRLIHNTDCTDPVILDKAKSSGLELIRVKQGYTKCSLVVVDEKSVITADMGLAAALQRYKIDVLPISQGHVVLPGFSYGFLGGASGRVGDEILFNGNLSAHPDFEKIREFITLRGLRAVWFEEYPLEDVGSVIKL
jgi:hypothetical protein